MRQEWRWSSRAKSSNVRGSRINRIISWCFGSAYNFSQPEGSATRGSPTDMEAADISATAILRLLRHRRRHYLRYWRSCQTTEQVLPRGAQSGTRDFLWYHTHGARRLEEVSPSVVDRSMWHAHSSRIPHYLTGRRRCLCGCHSVRCQWVSGWGVDQERLLQELREFRLWWILFLIEDEGP